jgi:hypothetical protein
VNVIALLAASRVSVAVQETVVAPSGNVEPLAGVHKTATLPSTIAGRRREGEDRLRCSPPRPSRSPARRRPARSCRGR